MYGGTTKYDGTMKYSRHLAMKNNFPRNSIWDYERIFEDLSLSLFYQWFLFHFLSSNRRLGGGVRYLHRTTIMIDPLKIEFTTSVMLCETRMLTIAPWCAFKFTLVTVFGWDYIIFFYQDL